MMLQIQWRSLSLSSCASDSMLKKVIYNLVLGYSTLLYTLLTKCAPNIFLGSWVLRYHPASIPVRGRINQQPVVIKEIWVENQPLALLGHSSCRKAGKHGRERLLLLHVSRRDMGIWSHDVESHAINLNHLWHLYRLYLCLYVCMYVCM